MRIPVFIARQGRCPSGWLGGLIARVMAHETAGENGHVLELLNIQPSDHLLELGFAHGRTLERAAKLVPEGFVAGVDPSERMLRLASRRNREAIAVGRMELKPGSSAALPFPDARFDKAYSVHTIYFWNNPAADLREIRRVLKPGGRLALGYGSRDDEATAARVPPSTHTLYTDAEVGEFLAGAGFGELQFTQKSFSPSRTIHFALAQIGRHFKG
jgi:SAM-dependent methyltransferase